MSTVFKKLPGVVSFQRGLLVSDAVFDNVFANAPTQPVWVVRHGIRGTQNINTASRGADKDTAKSATRQEVSNIQTTDTAKLHEHATGLQVRFEIRMLNLQNSLFACAPSKDDAEDVVHQFRQSVQTFIDKAQKSQGLQEVACRYARNILNGRWLWRNRTLAKSIKVTVRAENDVLAQDCDALSLPLFEFGDYRDAEKAVAAALVKGLQGDSQASLSVVATLDLGVQGAVEVFPSQNYVEDKPKGFARPLYAVGEADAWSKNNQGIHFEATRIMGHAALRDQKIGNALRTIDTWFEQYPTHGRPIPVEPNGASLDAQVFFRNKKTSAFEYAKSLNTLDPNSPEGMFMIASLIRGGVYSGGKEA